MSHYTSLLLFFINLSKYSLIFLVNSFITETPWTFSLMQMLHNKYTACIFVYYIVIIFANVCCHGIVL